MPELDYGEILSGQIRELGENIAKEKAERATADAAKQKALDSTLAAQSVEIAELKKRLEKYEAAKIPGLEYGSKGEKDKLSWARVIQICAEPRRLMQPGYEVEREAYEIMQKTAINAATGAGGGFLVPTTMMEAIVPELRERSIARQLGATVISGLAPGAHQWAKSKGGITAEHLNTEEEASGTESVATFDTITLTPRPIAAFVPLTRQMMTQTSAGLEAWVRREIATQIALLQDKSFFVGTGTQGAPLGLANTTGVQSFASLWTYTNSGTLWGDLVQMVLLSREKFALGLSGLGWAMSPRVYYALAKLRDGQNRPVFQSLTDGTYAKSNVPPAVAGYPAFDSDQLKTGTNSAERIIFGPFGDGFIGEWGTLELAMSDQTETNFRKGRATVRGIAEYDAGFFHAPAFVQSVDFDTTNALFS